MPTCPVPQALLMSLPRLAQVLLPNPVLVPSCTHPTSALPSPWCDPLTSPHPTRPEASQASILRCDEPSGRLPPWALVCPITSPSLGGGSLFAIPGTVKHMTTRTDRWPRGGLHVHAGPGWAWRQWGTGCMLWAGKTRGWSPGSGLGVCHWASLTSSGPSPVATGLQIWPP